MSIMNTNTCAPVSISVVVPTYNERSNIPVLVERIGAALQGISWEMIVVDDDSPDGTAQVVRELHQRWPQVRALQRLGRRGLAGACIEGMLAACGEFCAVIDADLQHDPALLRQMHAVLAQGEADLVIGSRYMDGGGTGEWDAQRLAISQMATRMAGWIARRQVSDPMSGYFALRRDAFLGCVRKLSTLGFKLLLDIIASSPASLRIRELPYTFGIRTQGESKLSPKVAWDYLMLLADKLVGHWVPVRFLAFAAIGAIGVGVHFLVLSLCFKLAGLGFEWSQTAATLTAIVFNFSVNNILTYSDQRLKGWRWLRGLAVFGLVCGIGATANVGVASYLFVQHASWPVAALSGIVLSAVWNYAVSARYTWKN